MLNKIIYIAGNSRSGSTVLDLLLGGHPLICSLGELHHLHRYADVNNVSSEKSKKNLCSCGKKVSDCVFWNDVERCLGRRLNDVELVLDAKENLKKELNVWWFFKRDNLIIFKKKIIAKVIRKYPRLLNNKNIFMLSGYKRIAINHFELCEAVCQATSKHYIVDSSKNPLRFKYLWMLNKDKILIIHLVRNPAATIYSMMKRGIEVEDAIKIWFITEKQTNELLKNISSDKKMLVGYEDLCKFPEKILLSICNKVNVKYDKRMIDLSIENKHHIQGSPSKYKYNGKIKFDKKYLDHLSQSQIYSIMEKTLPYSKYYGYHKVKPNRNRY